MHLKLLPPVVPGSYRRCPLCGRSVVYGNAVPEAARSSLKAHSYCAYDGSVYGKNHRRVGFIFGTRVVK